MAGTPKIVCFAGSLRRDSFNKKMVHNAMSGAQRAGAEVTFIDLKDFPMPLYDGDIEAAEGLPENAKKFKAILKQHHAFLIASPEYNSSISGALKNAIDWASRPEPGEKSLECFVGKVAGIMAASPGALGGLRGLVTLRSILENIHTMVITDQVALPHANEAFDDQGKIKDEKRRASVEQIGEKLARVAGKLMES